MNINLVEFIKSHRNTLDLIFDLVPIPLFLKDRAGRYIDCNEAFTGFMSFRRENIIGKSVYEIWEKDEADVFFAKDNELFEHGGLQVYETQITSSSGKVNVVQFHKQVFTDADGNIAGLLGAIFDITDKKQLETALVQLAVTDELTGLPNRRDGMEKMRILHAESERQKRPYCIAMIDIDCFKQINDQYGHSEGDFIINTFANMVKNTLRASDVCFRYGGEEFVVLLPDTELEAGFFVVERLRQAWAQTLLTLTDGQSVCSTVSIGLAQYYAGAFSEEQILLASDKALYVAKNDGRNRTVCFNATKGNRICSDNQ